MSRKLLAILLVLLLCWAPAGCGSPTATQSRPTASQNSSRSLPRLPSGTYPVQQATYNDADGFYSLMLLNTPPGTPSVFQTDNLQMARLPEGEAARGDETYLEIDGDGAVMYLTEDFKIEYLHAVTETQTNPQTGEPQTVVVRQESSFWSPFAGALAGQALGSLLFTPQYYLPPPYQRGGILTGYGGYGRTYDRAVERYRSQHNSPPPVAKNRQTLRTTGSLRRSPSTPATASGRQPSRQTKSTGSGYGASKLRTSGSSSPSRVRRSSGFGSRSGSRMGTRSFGGGRRR